ncbi:hypothetical protein AV656_05120 [Bhargavaea cecembensis]|uniref:DUF58 domain-containing protein n=1 Tax=Bhargavaea cecembensis TaxID=394098 RepID=A0A161REQ7_9BACL|nr:DUF58 domain-containing protein [Bhargavaea cecembensis]KZE38302.1 hypothetical protein AV656_05120 [Bhargavaea cecembensis]
MTESFFPSSDAVAAGRLRHLARSAPKGMHQGRNASGRSGTSPDFSDFQPYAPGDDIRNVDWNIYARTEQLFIKRFMDERELRVSVILDASRSMGGDRWLAARRLCAVLGTMALAGDDHMHFSAAGETMPFSAKGVRNRNRFLSHLEQLPSPEGPGFAGAAASESMPAASVRYIVTDGLEPPAAFRPLFRKLRKSAGEVRLILLTDDRPDVPVRVGDVRFVDSETGKAVDVTLTESAISRQQAQRERHFSELAALCREYGVSSLKAGKQESAAEFVSGKMRRAGWAR